MSERSSKKRRSSLSVSPPRGNHCAPSSSVRGRPKHSRSHSPKRDQGKRAIRKSGGGEKEDNALPLLYSIHQGTVRTIASFGCFVEMEGYHRHGLVHISQLAGRRVDKVEDVVSSGDSVWVKVLNIVDDKISLSLRDVDQGSGRDLNPSNDEPVRGGHFNDANEKGKMPKLNSIHKGICKTVKEFGAFIAIPGYYTNGMVHISQMAKFKIENVGEVLKEGDTNVWVKVIGIEEGKLSLSMKLVDQGSGKDLDPFHEEAEKEGSRKRKFTDTEKEPLRLEAILNTVCASCGGKGHLASECMVKEGQNYDLLSEPEEDSKTQQTHDVSKLGKTETRKKDQKEKKKKHGGAISSIEEAMRILAKAERKKKKKKKSKHKKKKKASARDSDSD